MPRVHSNSVDTTTLSSCSVLVAVASLLRMPGIVSWRRPRSRQGHRLQKSRFCKLLHKILIADDLSIYIYTCIHILHDLVTNTGIVGSLVHEVMQDFYP